MNDIYINTMDAKIRFCYVSTFSNIERRPADEGHVNEKSRNTAILFSTYHVGVGLIPNSNQIFKSMLKEAQISDQDIQHSLQMKNATTPEGKWLLWFWGTR